MSIKIVMVKSKSCKEYLINVKDWLRCVDSKKYACECDYLRSVLKCDLCHAGQHVCVVAYATDMRKEIQNGCSFESICLPGHSELVFLMKKGLNKIGRKLKITLYHKELVNDLYGFVVEDLYVAEGVQ